MKLKYIFNMHCIFAKPVSLRLDARLLPIVEFKTATGQRCYFIHYNTILRIETSVLSMTGSARLFYLLLN